MKTTLKVEGMTCAHCEAAVKGSLEEIVGVSDVEVDLATGEVHVTYDETSADVEKMKEAIENQGYEVA